MPTASTRHEATASIRHGEILRHPLGAAGRWRRLAARCGIDEATAWARGGDLYGFDSPPRLLPTSARCNCFGTDSSARAPTAPIRRNACAVDSLLRGQDSRSLPRPLTTSARRNRFGIDWLGTLRSQPVFVSDNNGFDWQFVCWYFHHFLGKNPFGFSSQNLGCASSYGSDSLATSTRCCEDRTRARRREGRRPARRAVRALGTTSAAHAIMRADASRFRATFSLVAAWPIATLLAAMSLGGLLTDAYARESPAWVDQAVGQDWFDLLVAAPFIAVCGIAARSSYRWRVLLAGAYAFTVYTLVIYVFAVHFNALFLLYCATLGLASFALIALLGDLGEHVQPVDRRGARVGGAFLVGLGAVFALMWLAEDLPAVLANRPSQALAATGLFTNPVHAIDLSFVLPAHVIAGVLLWRGRRAGERYAPVVLAFGILMSASIGGMLVAIAVAGGEAPLAVIAAMFAVSVATALVFARVSRGRHARADHPSSFSARAPARA